MDTRFMSWDPEQRWLLPPSVEELVPSEHPAHFVRDMVTNELDLSSILDDYRGGGRPAFHPAMMTSLLLYAYTQGVYSSRRIARGCEERVDFMAVTALQKPDFRTINLFRQRHLEALGGLFQQVLRLCRRAGLATLGHVSLDGSKVKANASKHKAMSYKRMREEEARLKAEVDRWFEEAEAVDTSEDEEFGERRGDELPEWVKSKERRLAKIREAREALEAEAGSRDGDDDDPEQPKGGGESPRPRAKAQRNFTDPDSRIMRAKGTFEQSYNAQIAVDSGSQVIVAQSVCQTQNDQNELIPIVRQIKSNLGRQARELSADTGYCSEANLKELSRRRIRGYVATGRQKHGAGSATETCRRRRGPYSEAMRRRLQRAGFRSRYRLRKHTVEPVFGQIKSARGFGSFLLRGIAKVKEEWSLICTAHNLLKLAKAR